MELAVEIQEGAFNKQTSVAVVSRVISTLMTPLELRDRTIHIRLAGVDAPEVIIWFISCLPKKKRGNKAERSL